MNFKIVAGVVAVVLLFAFIAPVVVKLKDPALIIVALIGAAMVLTDVWQSVRSKDD